MYIHCPGMDLVQLVTIVPMEQQLLHHVHRAILERKQEEDLFKAAILVLEDITVHLQV
jgi:hypothetical protein